MKKIILVVILLVALLPYTAFADDGTMMDMDGLVTYSIKFDKYECELGGTVDYNMTFKNLLPNEVNMHGITVNNEHRYYMDDPKIGAGQISILSVEDELVLPHYQWYPKKDGYYLDLYYTYGFETKALQDDYYSFYVSEFNKATQLKITNLNDGSDYIEISGIDETGFIDFQEWELKYTETDIPFYSTGYNTQTAKVTNISDKEVQLVTGEYLETILTPLKPGESIDWDITAQEKAELGKPLRNSELLSFNVTFMLEDKYYGVSQQRVYKCRYYPWDADLKLDVTVYDGEYKSLNEGYAFCKIDITNKGYDIPEFAYMFSDENIGDMHEMGEYDLCKEDFYECGTLTKGETISVYTRIKKNADIFGFFASGDSITNTWEYYELGNSGNKTRYDYLYFDGRIFDTKEEMKDESKQEQQNIEQKENLDENEKQVIEVTAQEPQSTPTLKPPKRIDTQRISSMPLWIGVLLAVSLVGSIAIIIALRKKQGV